MLTNPVFTRTALPRAMLAEQLATVMTHVSSTGPSLKLQSPDAGHQIQTQATHNPGK